MKKKLQLLFLGLLFFSSNYSQTLENALGDGYFIEGVSVVDTIYCNESPDETESVEFEAISSDGITVIEKYIDDDPEDGFSWSLDIGLLDVGSTIQATGKDSGNEIIFKNVVLTLDILPKPEWLVKGCVEDVEASESIISFTGKYPIYTYNYNIPSNYVAIGGQPLNIVGELTFNADFDRTTGELVANENNASVNINLLDQYNFDQEINFQVKCSFDEDLNLSLIAKAIKNSDNIELNMPKLSFPIVPGISINVNAGISLYATVLGQIVIGQDGDNWGFINNNGEKTKILGVLTGDGHIKGEVSILAGAASANASLNAKARFGVGFDYVSVPSEKVNFLKGGDIDISGEFCYKTFWGLGPNKCVTSESFIYNTFGDTVIITSLDNNLKSYTLKSTSTSMIPDFGPQPVFSVKSKMLYATWIEKEEYKGFIQFSKLNATGTAFSEEFTIHESTNSPSNPQIGIFNDGSAIISWSQNKYNQTSKPTDDVKTLINSQDVYFAIYDNDSNYVTVPEKVGDLNGIRPEGEAKVAVGSSYALLTWVVKDLTANSSDIYYSKIYKDKGNWEYTEPLAIAEMDGVNSEVNIVFIDDNKALVVWKNNPDGNDETVDSDLYFSEWDGNDWSKQELLFDNEGNTILNEVSIASNSNHIALAWTSTVIDEDEDFNNRIDIQVFNTITGEWDSSNEFFDEDSMYYFQKPIVSISETGIASVSYQVIEMYSDNDEIDNGELYLYVKSLKVPTSKWKEISENTNLCDTNTFIWELAAGFSAGNRFYTLTQEYSKDGAVQKPKNGTLFGDPSLSMVLRGVQIADNLSVMDISEPNIVPTGIRKQSKKHTIKTLSIFPNPSKTKSFIEFQLTNKSKVDLSIYSSSGIMVNNLINEELNIGLYKTVVNTESLPKGIYLVKLTIDSSISFGKLVKE